MSLPPALLALSPGDLARGGTRAFLEAVRGACSGGLDALLLREPGLGDRELLSLAETLRASARGPTWLAIHDRLALAGSRLFDAVHLGFRSLHADEARRLLGPGVTIGFSAHAHDRGPERAAADYLILGPVFETPSKRGRLAPLGLEGLAAQLRRTSAPVWALGGIDVERAAQVLAAGARGVAVLSGILGASDPARAVRGYRSVLDRRA